MPSDTMMALGVYRFALSTAAYQEFAHRAEYRWARQDVLGAPSTYQYLGPGEQTITLRGVIYPQYKGGLNQISLMRAQASLGIPLYLTDGTGRVWGQWCIKEVEETRRVFEADGTPRRVEFRIVLVRYDEGLLSRLRRAVTG